MAYFIDIDSGHVLVLKCQVRMYIFVSRENFLFVLGMWDKNYFNGENQMEASDFDLHSDQDSKSNKMSHPKGMAENRVILKECRHGSPIITPSNSPVHNLQKQSGSCHIKFYHSINLVVSLTGASTPDIIWEQHIDSLLTQYAAIDL